MQESTPPNGQQEMGMLGSLCSSSGLVDHSAHSPRLAWIHPGAEGFMKLKTTLHPGSEEMVSEGMSRCWLFARRREQSVKNRAPSLWTLCHTKRLFLKCIRDMMIKVHISEDLYPCPSLVLDEADKLHSNTKNKTGTPIGHSLHSWNRCPRG